MGRGGTEVDIQGQGRDDDAGSDQNKGEQQVFCHQWHNHGGWRNDLGQHQEVHSQRQQDVDTQRDLLPTVRRQVKHEDGDEGVRHQGNDQVCGVEETLATKYNGKSPLLEQLER